MKIFKSKSRHCPEYCLFWLNSNQTFWDLSSVIYHNAKLSVRTDEHFGQSVNRWAFVPLICTLYHQNSTNKMCPETLRWFLSLLILLLIKPVKLSHWSGFEALGVKKTTLKSFPQFIRLTGSNIRARLAAAKDISLWEFFVISGIWRKYKSKIWSHKANFT